MPRALERPLLSWAHGPCRVYRTHCLPVTALPLTCSTHPSKITLEAAPAGQAQMMGVDTEQHTMGLDKKNETQKPH